jgi:hypothetical protein
MGIGSGEAPDVPTVVPTPPLDEEAAPEPEGPEAASRQSGGAGIRTLKPVRAPHFESSAGAGPPCTIDYHRARLRLVEGSPRLAFGGRC